MAPEGQAVKSPELERVSTMLNWRMRHRMSEFCTMSVRPMVAAQLDVSMVAVIAGGFVAGLSLAPCDCAGVLGREMRGV